MLPTFRSAGSRWLARLGWRAVTVSAVGSVAAASLAGSPAVAEVVEARAVVSSVPTAPTNVVVTPGRLQLRVTWQPPAELNGATVTEYVVTTSPATAGFSTGSPNVFEYTIGGLRKGTEYEVFVHARTDQGDSATSSGVKAVVGGADIPKGPFTWDGTWNTSLWGPVTMEYREIHVYQAPGYPEPPVEFAVYVEWGTTATTSGQAMLEIGSDAFGDWSESRLDPFPTGWTTTRSGRVYVDVSPGGRQLTGEYTVRGDRVRHTDFTATCVAGPCTANTMSPQQVKDAADAPAPVVPRTSAIDGPRQVSKKRARAVYRFSATNLDSATFECRLDRRAWRRCASPFVLRPGKLSRGKHVLRVRAIGKGTKDRTPAVTKVVVR